MAGVLIKVAGVEMSIEDTTWIPPFNPLGLEAWGVLGGTLTKTLRNWAPGKPDFSQGGSITVGSYHATLQNLVGYITTSVMETDDMTMYAVISKAKQNANIITNNGVLRQGGSSVYPTGIALRTTTSGGSSTVNFLGATDGSYDGTLNGASSGVSAGLTRTASSGWRFVVAKFDEPAGVVRIRDMTAGDEATTTRVSGQRDKLTAPLWVGSSRLGDVNRNDQLDIAQFGILSRYTSDNEDTEIYEFMKDFYARRSASGIII
jgi:hypothetical protein